jgi:predicted RNA methylase
MLTKEISLTFLNHKISEVQQLIEQGYSLVVKNNRTKKPIFIINPPYQKYNAKDDDEFIDATDDIEDYIIPFTEAELTLPYEAQLKAAEKYHRKTYSRFVTPHSQS